MRAVLRFDDLSFFLQSCWWLSYLNTTPMLRQFLLHILIELPNKTQELIVGCHHIQYLFVTLGALVSDHVSLILLVIYPDWRHESMTRREAITWQCIVDMQWVETVWTVVACWSCRMECNLLLTILTREWLIAHDKTHRFPIYQKFVKRKVHFLAKRHIFW